MSQSPFPGYPTFLEAAARQIGHPEAEAPARRIATLAALSHLCSQAGAAGESERAAVLAKASEFRDQLHAAYRAAELMLAEVAGRPPASQPEEKAPGRARDGRASKGAERGATVDR